MNTVDKSILLFLVLLLVPAIDIQMVDVKENTNFMKVLKNLSMFASTVDRSIHRFLALQLVPAIDIQMVDVKENMHLHCK